MQAEANRENKNRNGNYEGYSGGGGGGVDVTPSSGKIGCGSGRNSDRVGSKISWQNPIAKIGRSGIVAAGPFR